MITETIFTLTEYKKNYDRLRDEFVNSYEDNDEDEFINLQTEWYQRCLETAQLDRGFVGDTIGWFPRSLLNGNDVVWEVEERIRNENGEIDLKVAQNISVSFGKILKFLKTKETEANSEKDIEQPTAAQWALYHYFLQENKMMPPFLEKTKEIKALAKEYKIGWKNFEMKYNAINKSRGLEGYSKKDVQAVFIILNKDYSSLIPQFEKLVLHSS